MRAEFVRPDGESVVVVGSATWTDDGIGVGAPAPSVADTLRAMFRPAPVVVDDPALLPPGSSGPVVLQPGSLLWFSATARAGASREGLTVRLVPPQPRGVTWDPAGSYRPFSESISRADRLGVAHAESERPPEQEEEEPRDAQPGETRPEGEEGPSAPGTEAAKPAPAPSAAGASEGPDAAEAAEEERSTPSGDS